MTADDLDKTMRTNDCKFGQKIEGKFCDEISASKELERNRGPRSDLKPIETNRTKQTKETRTV